MILIMETILIVIVFLGGFFFAVFLVWRVLPVMLEVGNKYVEIEKESSYIQGKNQVLETVLTYEMQRTQQLYTGIIELANKPAPYPIPEQKPQITLDSHTHSLTHSQNEEKKENENKRLQLIVRKSAKQKGDFSGNLKTVTMEKDGQKWTVNVEAGKLIQFGENKVWAGICLHCQNRFVTAVEKTYTCCASCNQNLNHSKR